LENKDKVISLLREVIVEKSELLESIGGAQVPKELLLNWRALEKMATLNLPHT